MIDGPPDPLLPENWDKLAPLVDAVLDTPIEEREAVLDDLSDGDPARRAELKSLVHECERELPLLDRPAAEAFAGLFAESGDVEVPEILGGRYRIDREVGRGGMARVFLARDIKHERDVAVKVIRQDVAASLGSERFLREIAIAARLRHPNIVPMYDSGETDGVLYFVMPYEEGPSLRARLHSEEPLSLTDRISVLRDIARALAYAHERGVVHRDIKPDNVLLSGGAAVVSDFGIAKAVSAAQAEAPEGMITASGARVGTPAYMAPEQAVGDPTTDHRADIYSFGCLAYELFTGKPPFEHGTTHELIAAHVGTRPAAIRDTAADVPSRLEKLIMSCLEKLPANRPQNAQYLLTSLEATQAGTTEVIHRPRVRTRGQIAAMAAVALLIIGIAGYSAWRRGAAGAVARESTVAVLPLTSTGDSVERDLAFGMSDEIAIALVEFPGVRVKSRRGAAASREGDVDPEKTGRELGVDYLVLGTLRQVGARLTVLARLVQAKDGALLWADQYERTPDDFAAVREEIAKAVGDSLRKRSGVGIGGNPVRSARVPAPEPYRFYVLGQQALSRRGQSIQASAERFRRATELDTLYAEAFGGLSLALALTPHFQPVSSMQVAGAATAAANRALRLRSTLAQPHVALGIVHGHGYRWESAAKELQTAVRLRSPSDVEPLVQYGRLLVFRGQTEEALRQFMLARNVEPASALVRSWVAYAYYLQGRMDSAIVEGERAFQNDSANLTTLALGSLILLKAGNIARARDYVRRINRYNHVAFYVLAATGNMSEARARIAELEKRRSPPWLLENSRAFLSLGARDTAAAITAFERATDAHDIWPSLEAIRDPIFDPVRSNPRFQRVLERVGLR